MSRSSNSLRSTDVITTPIKLKYTSSYDCSTIGSYGIQVLTGRNGPVTVTGSISEETLRYRSIRHLYYSNYLTGSYAVSASSADNFLQSTAASGTLDADRRYFPTESNAKITILSIPRGVFGEQISRRGFLLSSSLYRIVDDGNGNLIDIFETDLPPYVDNFYYSPIITDWYVYESQQDIFHVGNIIYAQGMVIITNPDYQDILNPDPPTANADSASFSPTLTPKTLNILANDDPGAGTLNPLSVVLSGGDVGLFTNNYDGTVTLTTTSVGTYTTYYTVESDLENGCALESNEASITVDVVADCALAGYLVVGTTTTSTTSTTTTSPTTTTTTTTSTTSTTTTAAPTTTTTSTTTVAPTTTTTSTTSTTTTVAPTTTTTSTTSTTTTAAPIATIAVSADTKEADPNQGYLQFYASVTSGGVIDTLVFDGTYERYTNSNCTSAIAGSCNFTGQLLNSGSVILQSGPLCDYVGVSAQSTKLLSLTVGGTNITTNNQVVSISGSNYRITGFGDCITGI